MKKYWLVFKLAVQNTFEYRLDFFFHTTKYAVMVLMMIMVWLAVQHESGQQLMSDADIIRYFVFAAILYGFSSYHTWYIEEDIKLGGLTKYLVKPIKPFLYYFTYEGSNVVCETVIKAMAMVPILAILNLLPTIEMSRLGVLLMFLPVIFLYSFHQFFIISTLAFWLHEIYAIRWALMIAFRFMAGVLVPLSFFPELVQRVLFWLPFPHLVYTPIQVLQGNIPINQAFQGFAILIFWTTVLHYISEHLWNKGSHSFESTGI